MFIFGPMKTLSRIFTVLVFSLSLLSCHELEKVAKVVNENLEEAYGSTLSTADIVGGLKAALEKGTGASITSLSASGGFSKSIYKLAVPEKAQVVGDKLRQYGMGKLVDDFEAKLNSAAESAVPAAKSIFVNAVKGMNFQDAMGILKGGNGAATAYFLKVTRQNLYKAFYPKISGVLNNSGTTKYWTDVTSNYNKLPGVTKVNADLNDYACQKVLDALFDSIRKEEDKIRANPAARTTDLLKKVFAAQD